MKKFFIYFLFGISCLVFVGCGEDDSKKIKFEVFSFDINNNYSQRQSGEIENKQIINKIVKAYVGPKNNGFIPNILIGKTPLKSDISPQQFSQGNIEKISNKLVGYNHIETKKYEFKCLNKNIYGMINKFFLPQDIINPNNNKSYFLQYYFTYGNNGYTISFTTNNKNNLDKYTKRIKTLNCN